MIQGGRWIGLGEEDQVLSPSRRSLPSVILRARGDGTLVGLGNGFEALSPVGCGRFLSAAAEANFRQVGRQRRKRR